MVQYMKVNGSWAWLLEKESSRTWLVKPTKASGMTTCATEKALHTTRTETDKTVSGSRTNKMASVSRTGQMVNSSKVTIKLMRKRVSADGSMPMDKFMKETGMPTSLQGSEFTAGPMDVSTMVNSSDARWRASVTTSTLMVASTWASTSEIRGKATVSSQS